MWVRFLKGHVLESTGKKVHIGKVMAFWKDVGERLISEGIAEKYEGPLPPPKMKTDFFKPKNIAL